MTDHNYLATPIPEYDPGEERRLRTMYEPTKPKREPKGIVELMYPAAAQSEPEKGDDPADIEPKEPTYLSRIWGYFCGTLIAGGLVGAALLVLWLIRWWVRK